MSESQSRPWRALRNPFQSGAESLEGIGSRVSGRSADIRSIIAGGQGAIIITGAPNIGKTSLVRSLRRLPDSGWTWRRELPDLQEITDLDHTYFLQIDLKPLEGIDNMGDVRSLFIEQCISSLRSLRQTEGTDYIGSRGLRALMREVFDRQPDTCCYFMLDGIERLQEPDLPQFNAGKPHSAQERSLALLDASGVLRLLVDLLDEFSQFRVILFLTSQPQPGIVNLYQNLSADLARFTTMMLQVLTKNDTELYLAQTSEILGAEWEQVFANAGVVSLFTPSEQAWLYEQAGTHPYLLQQLCCYSFQLKQHIAIDHDFWKELGSHEKRQLIELMNERVSAYLGRTWKRINQALQSGGQEARDQFYSFIRTIKQEQVNNEEELGWWEKISEDLRSILRSEGIVRYDPFMSIVYPGALLKLYLEQRVQEQIGQTMPKLSASLNQKELQITLPGKSPSSVLLSDIEYKLIKTLLDTPGRCSEDQLMQAAWEHHIDRSVFTQRMHHLRKKLRKYTDDEELIENRYGGIYLLSHTEWLSLQ